MMNMNCEQIKEKLVDYLDGALDAASMESVQQHLETCAACRQEMEELKIIFTDMDKRPMEQPGPSLAEGFRRMLQSELNVQAAEGILGQSAPPARRGKTIGLPVRVLWQAAAALVILLGGIWIGTRIKSNPEGSTPDQMAALRKEVKEMKEVVMFSLLDDESPTERLKAVSYVEDISNPDSAVIHALVGTLNHDKNVNVRLAALYSLARFADNATVRDSLITSLPGQTEPLIQVVLINLLAEKREKRAIGPIRDILNHAKTMKEVKDAAQKGLKTI
jgi:hypothetical protein